MTVRHNTYARDLRGHDTAGYAREARSLRHASIVECDDWLELVNSPQPRIITRAVIAANARYRRRGDARTCDEHH